jgi:hypothetical protein
MNPIQTLRFFGLAPIEADAVLRPRWLLPLEYLSPSIKLDDGPQFAHPESGLARDLELASMLTVMTSTLGAWGH